MHSCALYRKKIDKFSIAKKTLGDKMGMSRGSGIGGLSGATRRKDGEPDELYYELSRLFPRAQHHRCRTHEIERILYLQVQLLRL